MLGILLESRLRRPLRTGGAALSVATHIAVIGLATAATARVPSRQPKEPPLQILRFDQRPAARDVMATQLSKTVDAVCLCIPNSMPRFQSPDVALPKSSAIDVTLASVRDPGEGVLTPDPNGRSHQATPGTILGGGNGTAGENPAWNGSETLMRVLSIARPRYPEVLRSAGVSGRVVIRFVVDTTGRIELSSVQVLETTHDLFTRAVRDILPALRFRPADRNGQRTRSLAEMPFEFQLR